MQLQKFVGESMPTVLSNLKDALGSDAIILANRRVGDHIEIIATGTLDEASFDDAGLFSTDNNSDTEVVSSDDERTAAINIEVSADENMSADNSEESETFVGDDTKVVIEDQQSTDSSIFRQDAVSSEADTVTVPKRLSNTNDTDTDSDTDTATATETETETDTDTDTDIALLPSTEATTMAMAGSIATLVNIEVEKKLEQFHTTMSQRLSQLEVNLWGEKDPVKSKHLKVLLEIGLGAELAVALVNRVDASMSFENALRRSLSDLANTLPVASDRSLTHDGITFVTGPSGSGKTTTLLKLAAQKTVMSGSDSVVMICADAKRIGVFESLAAHGNALGVSVVCASTQQELQELLQFYSNKELVLVDQAFQTEFNQVDVPGIDSDKDNVSAEGRSIRHLLVLPATIQSSVVEDLVSEFCKHPSVRCVITNLDRPCRVGELFTTIIRHNLRVAYWSDCNDIHEPLNKASAHTLVATAMAMTKRLIPSEDEKYLMELIHPRFSVSMMPLLRTSL